jgi:hypothetical protein
MMHDGLFYADLDFVKAQLAAWLDLHTPDGYRCRRCGDERWSILSVHSMDTKDHFRFRVMPGAWTACYIGCLVCHQVEIIDITQLNLMQ